MVDRS